MLDAQLLKPIVDFLATFPQWFQMLVVLLVILGGGLTLLIRTFTMALKAGLLDFFQMNKRKKK